MGYSGKLSALSLILVSVANAAPSKCFNYQEAYQRIAENSNPARTVGVGNQGQEFGVNPTTPFKREAYKAFENETGLGTSSEDGRTVYGRSFTTAELKQKRVLPKVEQIGCSYLIVTNGSGQKTTFAISQGGDVTGAHKYGLYNQDTVTERLADASLIPVDSKTLKPIGTEKDRPHLFIVYRSRESKDTMSPHTKSVRETLELPLGGREISYTHECDEGVVVEKRMAYPRVSLLIEDAAGKPVKAPTGGHVTPQWIRALNYKTADEAKRACEQLGYHLAGASAKDATHSVTSDSE